MNNPPVENESGTSSGAQPPPAGGCDRPPPKGPPGGGHDVAVVGVRVHDQVRVTQYNSGERDFEMGQMIVLEGDRLEIGEVAQPTTRARKMCAIGCMKRALRVATEDDLKEFTKRARLEDEAHAYCQDLIRRRRMPMKLVQAQCVDESRKITFSFTADGRVDFRELVRELARRFRSRIEMRQIGVRDEARTLGGYGDCGKALCCSTFLKGFSPISIKMARAQNLSLNPSKISGMCGRLKCCLRYEYTPAGGDAAGPPEDEVLPPAPPEQGSAPPLG